MALTKYEQEVVINFNAADDTADLYTADPVWMRKMDKLVEQNPAQFQLKEVQRYHGKIISKRYIFPKRFVSIRTKDTKRELTEEQKKQLSERMAAHHKNASKRKTKEV